MAESQIENLASGSKESFGLRGFVKKLGRSE